VQPDTLTLLSFGLVGYLTAPIFILLIISLHKESRHERPLGGVLWFGVAMMVLCTLVILLATVYRAAVLGSFSTRIQTPSFKAS
jgi:hypothetical protein